MLTELDDISTSVITSFFLIVRIVWNVGVSGFDWQLAHPTPRVAPTLILNMPCNRSMAFGSGFKGLATRRFWFRHLTSYHCVNSLEVR